MDQNQDSSLFGLTIDPISKNHLSEAARWAKFLAIVGFVMCGLLVIISIFAGSLLSGMGSRYGRYESDADMGGALAVTVVVIYLVIAILLFLPYLFLFRFATKMKAALVSNDQQILNGSFQNLKIMFRYVGIFTIIVLSIYAIMLLIVLAGAGANRF
jgi:hypothetical protein